MSNGKSFLVDLTKCTACRGCQIACKQWKKLPGEKTKNTGTHQNPPDFSYNTLRVVRFSEQEVEGRVQWFFTPDQCRHCLDAPCKTATNDPGAILIDEETGAVVYTEKTAKEAFDAVQSICPYNVPRQDAKTKIMEDLVKGSIQAVVADSPVAVEYTTHKYTDKIKIAGTIKSDKVENIGIAVKKGNKDVLDLVNKGLAAIKADGTFDKIKAQHNMQ